MKKSKQTTNAIDILHRRYIRDDADRKASLQIERVNAEVAQMVYELRQEAGLTQKDLADLIGTTQSVISRLEDADYEGHSLTMLNRIAKMLNKRLTIQMTTQDPDVDMVRYAFREVLRNLRRERGLKIEEFAKESGVGLDEAISIERSNNYCPTPLALYRLSKFYGISQRKLAVLAGAIKDIPREVKEQASRFAAQSDSFSKLTHEERRTLDEFVKFLREDGKEE
jgi:transcriptional regulator with XRE-family HTH domain